MDALLEAVDTLHALVRGSFGPSGEHTLVFAPPDPPLITGDGHAVLRARKRQLSDTTNASSPSSPFERVILDASEGVYRETGDGSTQFVLLLHSVLHQIRRGHGEGNTERLRIVQALGRLRHELGAKPLLSREAEAALVLEEKVVLEVAKDGEVAIPSELQTRIEQVLTTALSGVLGHRILPSIVALVVQWIFVSLRVQHVDPTREPVRFLHGHLQRYLQQAPRAIIHAIGASFTASHVVDADAFVIRKSLIPSQLPSLVGGIKPVRFVCFTGSLDLTTGSNHITFESTRGAGFSDAAHALDEVRVRSIQFLTELRMTHDVRLIVSAEKIDDHIAAECNHLDIACVQYAESEDIEALCSIAGIHAVSSVTEEIQSDRHIGVCSKGVMIVRHSQSPSLYLRGLRRAAAAPQLVVYASSKAVYKQYYNAILKCLRVVRCLFDDHASPRSVRLCRGAGATELAIAKELRMDEQQRLKVGDIASTQRQVKLILSTALVESVARLRTNLTQGCGASQRSHPNHQSDRVLLDEMTRLDCSKAHGYVLDMNHVISTKLGSVQIPALVNDDPSVYRVLHPWQRVETIIYAVVQTAEMLLRVDAVVHVKRNAQVSRV